MVTASLLFGDKIINKRMNLITEIHETNSFNAYYILKWYILNVSPLFRWSTGFYFSSKIFRTYDGVGNLNSLISQNVVEKKLFIFSIYKFVNSDCILSKSLQICIVKICVKNYPRCWLFCVVIERSLVLRNKLCYGYLWTYFQSGMKRQEWRIFQKSLKREGGT